MPVPSYPIPLAANTSILPATPTSAYRGVALADAATISGSIHKAIAQVFATLPPGKSGVALDVNTARGLNLVVGQRIGARWQVVGYVGKYWDAALEGGVALRGTW